MLFFIVLWSPIKLLSSCAPSAPSKHGESMIEMSSDRTEEKGDANTNAHKRLEGNQQTPDALFLSACKLCSSLGLSIAASVTSIKWTKHHFLLLLIDAEGQTSAVGASWPSEICACGITGWVIQAGIWSRVTVVVCYTCHIHSSGVGSPLACQFLDFFPITAQCQTTLTDKLLHDTKK